MTINDRYLEEAMMRRRANTASTMKAQPAGISRIAELSGVSPLSSEQSSPRSSHKYVPGTIFIKHLREKLKFRENFCTELQQYQTISIFHVFLVWMGKSIPRA